MPVTWTIDLKSWPNDPSDLNSYAKILTES